MTRRRIVGGRDVTKIALERRRQDDRVKGGRDEAIVDSVGEDMRERDPRVMAEAHVELDRVLTQQVFVRRTEPPAKRLDDRVLSVLYGLALRRQSGRGGTTHLAHEDQVVLGDEPGRRRNRPPRQLFRRIARRQRRRVLWLLLRRLQHRHRHHRERTASIQRPLQIRRPPEQQQLALRGRRVGERAHERQHERGRFCGSHGASLA